MKDFEIISHFNKKWAQHLEGLMGLEVDPFDPGDYLRVDTQADVQKNVHGLWSATSDAFKSDFVVAAKRLAATSNGQYPATDWGRVLFKNLMLQALRAKFGKSGMDYELWQRWSMSDSQSGDGSPLGRAIAQALNAHDN